MPRRWPGMSWRVVASKIRYEQHRPVAVAHQGPIHEDRLPRALRETTRVPINGAGDRLLDGKRHCQRGSRARINPISQVPQSAERPRSAQPPQLLLHPGAR